MGRKRVNNLGLPPRVYIENGAYYYRQDKEKRIHLGYTLGNAEQALKRMTGKTPPQMHVRHLGIIRSNARGNAKFRNLPFELTKADMDFIWRRSGGRCELTHIPFDLLNSHGHSRRAYAPSIDRIDCKLGYSIDNCRLVLVAINIALNEFGEDIFGKVAAAYLRYKAARILHTALPSPQLGHAVVN